VFRLPLTAGESQRFVQAAQQPGKVFVYPTESFYALGCLATDDLAVQQIFTLKQRPDHLPLLVLVSGFDQLRQFSGPLSSVQENFLSSHWPGPLSVLLPACGLSKHLNPTGGPVAFRMPPVPDIRRLIQLTGVPWVGTSANLSRSPSLTDLTEVRSWLGDQVDLWIDGGDCPGGLASTVLSLDEQGGIKILRQGQWLAPESHQ